MLCPTGIMMAAIRETGIIVKIVIIEMIATTMKMVVVEDMVTMMGLIIERHLSR